MKKVLLFILCLILLTGCGTKQQEETYNNLEDLEGKTVAVMSGTFHAQFLESRANNINIKYLNTVPECLLALKANKVDAFLTDEPIVNVLMGQNEGIDFFVLENSQIDSGFIFAEDGKLLQEFNEFVKESEENGFKEKLINKWIKTSDAINQKVDNYEYNPVNGQINIITVNDSSPFCFVSDGELQGFSIEYIKKFACDYGYELLMDTSTFEGLLSSVAAGKYDIGVDEINITEERKKNMIFSEPTDSCSIAVVYRTSELNNEKEYTSVSELDGQKLGCMSGSIFDLTIKENFKNSDVVYFNSRAELLMGLKQGKVEGYLADRPTALVFSHDNDDIKVLDENIQDCEYGLCFSKKATKLKAEFNDYLKEIEKEGYLQELQDKWFVVDGIDKEIEDIELTGENGTIKACTTPDAAPFSFYKENKYQGYEVELVMDFARRYGYGLEIEGTSFDALISSVASNKFDMAFNGVYITEERAKSVDFSDPDYVSYAVAIVRNNSSSSNVNFIDSIKNKLYRTFIEEERYKLIIDGILTTLLITAVSLLFGTIIGFVCFLLARKFKGVVKKVIDAIAYIIAGLPVVVILMILFYIIFAKSSLSGVAISIVGFSIIVGLSIYGMLKTGVDAIDIGQYEGALALGYTDSESLFKFILPQAFRIIMPSYRNEIISLIKSSSIVGYVTVQDLTRVSDIIRSRTYDAFFPLIVTAVIYFILAWLLTKVANYLQKRFLSNEKTKEEILKNVGQKSDR